MRNLILIILSPYIILCQEVTETSIFHDGIDRSYILYVPESYNDNSPVPLILNLHGYSSNAGQQMIYSNFYPIADLEGFILVHPEGTYDENGFAYWNSAGITEVDDIGFLNSLIDTIDANYNINLDRVYSMGMSNGGFMSYTLACELSDKIAAIASVTGSMNDLQMLTCNPTHSMPVMQIHGTADAIVPYAGNDGFISSIDDVTSYWVDFNECNTNAIINNIPNINLLDLCEAEHYLYENGINGSSVELYKIINGGHTWPGALIPITGSNTNQDFNASEKIWDFFNKYDINGVINNSATIEYYDNKPSILKRIDLLGRQIQNAKFYIDIYDNGKSIKKLQVE